MAGTDAVPAPVVTTTSAVPPTDAEVASLSGNVLAQDGSEYKSRGTTKVASRWGNSFAPADQSLPVITAAGINVTAAQASALIEDASYPNTGVEDLLHVVTNLEA